ncbi:MAG: MerR family transcriptional regulator [Thermodesulfobacteriota bacterium]
MNTTPADPTLTHKLLAKALGVTVTTVKSYRRKFPEFWQVASQGKPIRYSAESLELCRRIRHHFRRGLSVEETRKRLAEEFTIVTPAQAPDQPAAVPARDPLARMEALMEGLFNLQNRTHSLLAELVSKLDTLADRLGESRPAHAAGASGKAGAAPSRVERAITLQAASVANGGRPPASMTELPVVVRSGDGEFLGVTSPTGRPFTLAQFEEFLVMRQSAGAFPPRWTSDGEEWTLRLEGGGTVHEHHFARAVTPRGNAVARFTSLSVDGARSSDDALQAFLRKVKESFVK